LYFPAFIMMTSPVPLLSPERIHAIISLFSRRFNHSLASDKASAKSVPLFYL
jgi:hypothetical protein